MMKANEIYEYLMSLPGVSDYDVGCEMNEVQQRIDDAYALYSGKGICVVADWKWVDIELTKQGEKRLPSDLKPALLFADTILEDSPQRGIDWVKTSMLVEYQHPGLFVTRNTCYVMVGLGVRCKVRFGVV